MSEYTAVILGFGIVFAGIAWIGSKLSDSEQPMFSLMGTMFVALSVAFLQIVGWAALEIANNNGMTYISNGATIPVMWVVNIVMIFFWLGLLFKSIAGMLVIMWGWFSEKFGRGLGPFDGGS